MSQRKHGARRRRGIFPGAFWSPYFVLFVALGITGLVSQYVMLSADSRDAILFNNAVQRVQSSIQHRLETHTTLLRGATALFAGDAVDHGAFRIYVDRLMLEQTYPGVQGIGIALRIRPIERQEVILRVRQRLDPTFTIRPDYERPSYFPVVQLEPLDHLNALDIGYDLFTEEVRRTAMERARDTGLPAMSGKVRLLRGADEDEPQAGFVICVPFYRGGLDPEDLEMRRELLDGFVFSPFRADDLFYGIIAQETNPSIRWLVYDTDRPTPESLLHAHESARGSAEPAGYESRYSTVRRLELAGRTWTILYSSQPAFEAASERRFVPLVLLAGLMVSLTLFAVARGQSRARMSAERNAEARDIAQQQMSAELSEAANYVKSLLPAPMKGEIAVGWKFLPSSQLGGDAFGYHWLNDEEFAVYLLDVSGHGVGSALLSSSVTNLLRSHTLPDVNFRKPDEVLTSLNAAFPMSLHNNKFFTIWYGVFNKKTRILNYATGGHPPAVLVSCRAGSGAFKLLQTNGPIVGAFPDMKFDSASLLIEPKSQFYLFSDGAYEFMKEDRSRFTLEELIQFLTANCDSTGTSIETVFASIDSVKRSVPYTDDVSMVEVVFN